MTIQSVRVANKVVMISERFQKWLLGDAAPYVQSVLSDPDEKDALRFTVLNADYLTLGFPNSKDKLVLRTSIGLRRACVSVSFMEHMEDEDGGHYESLNTEDFTAPFFDRAIECFMERWSSKRPELVSSIKSPGWFQNTPSRVLEPIDITMTPKQIEDRLQAQRMASLSKYRESLYSVKHLESGLRVLIDDENQQFVGRLKRPDTDNAKRAVKGGDLIGLDHGSEGMVTIFKDGVITELGKTLMRPTDGSKAVSQSVREIADISGIEVIEVGYTGDKNNHGTGSLDHISW